MRVKKTCANSSLAQGSGRILRDRALAPNSGSRRRHPDARKRRGGPPVHSGGNENEEQIHASRVPYDHLSIVRRVATLTRRVIKLEGVVRDTIGPVPVLAPSHMRAADPARTVAGDRGADDRTRDECSRWEPVAVIFTIAAVIGAVAAMAGFRQSALPAVTNGPAFRKRARTGRALLFASGLPRQYGETHCRRGP